MLKHEIENLSKKRLFNSKYLKIDQYPILVYQSFQTEFIKKFLDHSKGNEIINIFLVGFDNKFIYGLANYLNIYPKLRENVYIFFSKIYHLIRHRRILSQDVYNNILVIDIKNFKKCLDFIDDQKLILPLSLKINLISFSLIENSNIIRTWSSIVNSWLNKKIKYDGYTAFFSTLGGAYSSLGEESYEHAKNAEKISKKQLFLAYAFNDPNAICRCKLFLAFSYIQLLKFNEANYILRNEYKFLNDEKNKKLINDGKLRIMCIAGLKKLRFVYEKFKINNAYFSERGKLRS